MMASLRTFLSFALITLMMTGAAQPLPPGEVLTKLSLRLRGVVPTAAEARAFKEAVEADPTRFAELYDAKVAAYLTTDEFRGVVEGMHSVWWRLPRRETTAFAAHVVMNDRPYWEIFDRKYIVLDGVTAERYERVSIGSEGPLPTVAGDWRIVRLRDDEPRFRSILSDLDFLNQYPDTPTNRNRARANYMFRTFLCETLTPSSPTESFADRLALADELEDDDPHGSDPDCVGCHYRLDPMARFFDRWRPPFPNTIDAWFDGSQAASGSAIVLDGAAPRRVYNGVTETALGREFIREPRVHQCVVQRVWDFVFGPGVKIPDAASASLVQAFDARSNYKDLLTATLKHPYFWSTEEAPPLRFADVKLQFSGCGGSCHRPGGPTSPAFDPTTYPFAADHRENVDLLRRMWGAMNHVPGFVPMPRAPRPKLPSESLAQIREWISAEALDDAGQPTLTPDEIKEVLDD